MKKYFIIFAFILLALSSTTNAHGKYVVAVLNFQNNSGNVELNYLRNAIPEMLITNLMASSKITIEPLKVD